MSESQSEIFITIADDVVPERADKLLAELLPEHTRGTIQNWIRQGLVRQHGQPIVQKKKLMPGDMLTITIPEAQSIDHQPEDIPLNRVYEDADLLVINKPAGLVVHPGAGNPGATLLNGLLFHLPDNASLPRAGIVHRLDKGTTGLMVVAKSESARQSLTDQLSVRQMKRRYLAVVEGILVSGLTVERPIGRHRHDRLKMAVTSSGKPATTHFRVKQKFRRHTLVQAELETGRTHQIRVHLGYIGHTIVGDRTYGNRNHVPPHASQALIDCIQLYDHQALHAYSLTLTHPKSGETMRWQADLPEDMENLLGLLEVDFRSAGDLPSI